MPLPPTQKGANLTLFIVWLSCGLSLGCCSTCWKHAPAAAPAQQQAFSAARASMCLGIRLTHRSPPFDVDVIADKIMSSAREACFCLETWLTVTHPPLQLCELKSRVTHRRLTASRHHLNFFFSFSRNMTICNSTHHPAAGRCLQRLSLYVI